MNKKLLAVVLLTCSGVAWGACKPGQVAGSWVISVVASSTNSAQMCFALSNAAGWLSGTCVDMTTAQNFPIENGRIALSTECGLTGSVSFGAGSTVNVFAQLTRNKQIGTGVFWTNFGNVGTITFVRR